MNNFYNNTSSLLASQKPENITKWRKFENFLTKNLISLENFKGTLMFVGIIKHLRIISYKKKRIVLFENRIAHTKNDSSTNIFSLPLILTGRSPVINWVQYNILQAIIKWKIFRINFNGAKQSLLYGVHFVLDENIINVLLIILPSEQIKLSFSLKSSLQCYGIYWQTT